MDPHTIGIDLGKTVFHLGRACENRDMRCGLIPAQYVKPYVKTNKSDYIGAEAIAEAVCTADDALCADQDR
jgi:transposase